MIFDVWHCDECALVARATPRPTPNIRGNGHGSAGLHGNGEGVMPPAAVPIPRLRGSQEDEMAGEKAIADYIDEAEAKRARLVPALPRSPTTLPPEEPGDDRGLRYNEDKPRHSLISAWAMRGLAAVLTFGAKRYAEHNWRKGLSWAETIDSLERHLEAFKRCEDLDDGPKGSGLPHIDHVLCNAMFLSEFFHLKRGTDDRWRP